MRTPAFTAGVPGGPIVPEKYLETASARGKVARAGGKTTRGAPGRLEPAAGRSAAGRGSGEPEGRPGGVGTMTLQRPPEPAPTTSRRRHGRAAAAGGPGPVGLSPRHWKVRTKLAAVLLVPAIAFLVLASINMAGQIGSARDFGRGANVAEFGRQASALVHELQAERDIAAGYVAPAGRTSNQPARSTSSPRTTRSSRTSPRRRRCPAPELRGHAGGPAAQRGQRAVGVPGGGRGARRRRSEAQSGSTRPATSSTACPAAGRAGPQLLTEGAINGKYTAMITSLLNINRQIGQGAGNTELNNAGRRPHRARRPQGDAVRGAGAALQRAPPAAGRPRGDARPAATSSSGSSRSSPRSSPSACRAAAVPCRRRHRASSPRTTRWSTARPCSRSSGWRTASPRSRTRRS